MKNINKYSMPSRKVRAFGEYLETDDGVQALVDAEKIANVLLHSFKGDDAMCALGLVFNAWLHSTTCFPVPGGAGRRGSASCGTTPSDTLNWPTRRDSSLG